jgi:hypothetical protein
VPPSSTELLLMEQEFLATEIDAVRGLVAVAGGPDASRRGLPTRSL